MGLFRKKRTKYGESGIVVSEGVRTKGAEGYNRLRDNILFLNADGKAKVIQIESSTAGEGKTTTACNLAVSLGLTEKKVCVVDLDFRRPRVHRIFELSKDQGIAEYVLGEVEADKVIKSTKYKNVDIITRGAEICNSTLVLMSERFKALMKELRDTYDFVIVDCAPILQVSDYIHISKVTDGTLFLIAYAKTTKSQVAEAVKELTKNDGKILGTVISMYDRKERDYNYYYY